MFWPFKRKTKDTTPDGPIVVVAGEYRQARIYITDVLGFSPSDRRAWLYVSTPDDLRGIQVRPGQVHYVGTFWERKDLEEIATNALIATRLPYKP
jgi:hypothetical protein